MYLEPTDIIILLGISQGIFLALLFPFLHKTNKRANGILSILLAMASVMLISRTLSIRVRTAILLQWVNLADILIFLFGPLAYFYFRRLLFKDYKIHRTYWLHFLPALLHLLFFFSLLEYTPITYEKLHYSGYFNQIFHFIEGVAIVLNFFYAFSILNLVRSYQKIEKNQLSFHQEVIGFVLVVTISIFMILILWALSYISQQLLHTPLGMIGYETIWISLPLGIYIISFYAIRQPEIFRISKSLPTTAKNRLKFSKVSLLKDRLDNLMEQERPYLDGELTLTTLADQLQTSSNDLSWLLNTTYDTKFYDFVNNHRIKAFLQRVDNNEHHKKTILSLALEVGFNSKSTFNKAFKALLNDTPSNYIKKRHHK